jgi:NAD(P)-dependent dehydrogenase (short-subunit alcohol dehydrogenase family)
MNGRVIIVTGAFGVLGGDVVAAFAKSGDRVAAIDLAAQAPTPLSEQLGEGGLAVASCNLTDSNQAQGAVEDVVARFGRIDALVNLAGGFAWETLAEGSQATWDDLYAINVRTCANMCRAAIPALTDSRGSIVNVGAAGALKAVAGMGAYAASKSGVHTLTESLADELKGRVRVNAVLPSILDTPRNRGDMPDADFSTWVSPAELAGVILFLTSKAAAPITGALIPVMGRV